VSDGASHHQEEALGKAYDARLMRRLLGYVRPYRWRMVAAVGLIIVSALLQLVGPLATAVALDLYIQPPGEEESVSPAGQWVERHLAARGIELDPLAGIAAAALVYLASLVLAFAILYWQAFVMQLMGQHIMRDLRREIFGHLQRLHLAYFDRNPIGRLVTRVTNDVDALNELFTSGLVAIFGDLFLLLGIVAVLFWLDWRLALITLSIIPLLLALTLWFKLRARDMYRLVRVKLARIAAFLQEHISGMAVLQLFGREQAALEQFGAINREHRDANVKAIFYYAVFFPAAELITALGLGLILWYGGLQVVAGTLSVGALVAFFQYAQRTYQPLSDLAEKYNILQAAMAASERIFGLLDTAPALGAPATPFRPAPPAVGAGAPQIVPRGPAAAGVGEGPAALSGVRGEVELDRVCFEYQAGEPVLRDVSFRIAPGQTVAVVGHTGAGKSTLASLLLRFYDVTSGAVRIDGVDVREWDPQALRQSMGIVLQDVFLFSGTIADNIRLGSPRISAERLLWAAAESHALDFVQRLPDGLDTVVRERGAGLSQGQKQLVAIARALAYDPRILILDEATASIDSETEARIQDALDRLLVGRTSLVIAHRLSTVQRADRIVVLHKGELREQGTHHELLARRGIYYRLYLLQYQDRAAPAPVEAPAELDVPADIVEPLPPAPDG
jgi:ATP-binding cassette, subfamily B, multidrug efflux pump